MKTCNNCRIEVEDDEIFCPKCGEMLNGGDVDGDSVRVAGGYSTPPQPEPLSARDVVLERPYGRRIIHALRAIATAISFVTAGTILAVGVLTLLGQNPLKIPEERQLIYGLLALPVALIAGFLLYFIFNIAITKYENLSLVGRNTEAQIALLENQSQLISSMLDALNENNRRIDVIGEMLDDVLRLEEKQITTVEGLSTGEKTEDTTRDDSLNLINENLCNGAFNTQTMLRRVETAVNNGLSKLYRMWYSALNKGEEPPEDDLSPSSVRPEPAPRPEPVFRPKPLHKPEPAPAPEPVEEPAPEPAAETVSEPEPEPVPEPAYEAEPEVKRYEPKRPDSYVDPLDEMDKQSSGELLLGEEDYELYDIITQAASDDSSAYYLPHDADGSNGGNSD